MKNPLQSRALSRRGVLTGITVASSLTACASITQTENKTVGLSKATKPTFDFDDPLNNVAAMARLAGDLDPAKSGRVKYKGRAFGLVPGQAIEPLYGIEGMGTNRIEVMPDGSHRFLFSEFAVYTDLKTGEPLSEWSNPFTGRVVEVWHQRNGPINFALSPGFNVFGQFDAVDSGDGFQLPWEMIDGYASFALDVTSKRSNPLTPETWPMESSGETMFISEHSQYFVDPMALSDESKTSLSFHATLQSNKPWHPWMQMGQRPGFVFARLSASKINGIGDLSPKVARFAQDNLADWIDAPSEWTGDYYTAHRIYGETKTPAGPE
nr:DUF1838 family protein [Hyphomonas sp. Mor2]